MSANPTDVTHQYQRLTITSTRNVHMSTYVPRTIHSFTCKYLVCSSHGIQVFSIHETWNSSTWSRQSLWSCQVCRNLEFFKQSLIRTETCMCNSENTCMHARIQNIENQVTELVQIIFMASSGKGFLKPSIQNAPRGGGGVDLFLSQILYEKMQLLKKVV